MRAKKQQQQQQQQPKAQRALGQSRDDFNVGLQTPQKSQANVASHARPLLQQAVENNQKKSTLTTQQPPPQQQQQQPNSTPDKKKNRALAQSKVCR
jgi:hypothetical protein